MIQMCTECWGELQKIESMLIEGPWACSTTHHCCSFVRNEYFFGLFSPEFLRNFEFYAKRSRRARVVENASKTMKGLCGAAALYWIQGMGEEEQVFPDLDMIRFVSA